MSHCARIAARSSFALAVVSLPALAHGIGERYDLPVPLWLWVSGAGIVVAASFIIATLALRNESIASESARIDLTKYAIGRFLTNRWLQGIAQACTVAALVLVVAASLIGDQTPTRNIAPVTIWVIWWVGFAYFSALVGDLWSVLNPWATVFTLAQKAARAIGLDLEPHPYPARFGAWPAVVLFAAFSWIELVYDSRSIPSQLGILVVGYSVIAWGGMLLYGRDAWLAYADPFAVAFRTLARFAPIEIEEPPDTPGSDVAPRAKPARSARNGATLNPSDAPARKHKLLLRPYAAGLVSAHGVSTSMLVFVSLMLSTVTFDGFLATPAWNAIEGALVKWASALGGSRLAIINTSGLVVFACAFLALYLVFSVWMSRACDGALSPESAAKLFVMSLVPIAIGYHLAHYLTYLLTQGQLVIRLGSDPFGFGWNIFGTARYRPNYEVVGARFTWYVAVFAIVVGHIFAVYAAHKIAFRTISDRRQALRSQFPMLLLMIGYTMMSLWIIAQPVTASSN